MSPTSELPGPSAAAVDAKRRAEAGLRAVWARQPEVTRVAEQLRGLRERNGFSEALRLVLQQGAEGRRARGG